MRYAPPGFYLNDFEIYLDGIPETTALSYRYLDGYCSLIIDGINKEFSAYSYNR